MLVNDVEDVLADVVQFLLHGGSVALDHGALLLCSLVGIVTCENTRKYTLHLVRKPVSTGKGGPQNLVVQTFLCTLTKASPLSELWSVSGHRTS